MLSGLGSIVHHTSLEGHSNSPVLMQRLSFPRCEECPKGFPVFQDESFCSEVKVSGIIYCLLLALSSSQSGCWGGHM